MAVGRSAVQEVKSLVEALGPVSGDVNFRVLFKSGDRRIVEAPFGTRQLRVPLRGKLQGQSAERGMSHAGFRRLADHGQHGLLDPRMEHIVIRGGAASRGKGLLPRSSLEANPRDPFSIRPASTQHGFQLGQRGSEFQRRDHRQPLAVKKPQEHFQHVFADRILP